jgi:hypothetical protein
MNWCYIRSFWVPSAARADSRSNAASLASFFCRHRCTRAARGWVPALCAGCTSCFVLDMLYSVLDAVELVARSLP